MKFKATAQYLFLYSIILLIYSTSGASQSLMIKDCQGFTRALQSVKSGELNTVKISMTDATGNPLNGARVTLTNSLTGEVTTVVSENGFAVFDGLAEGTFSISTTATGASVGAISITGASLGAIAATGAAVGAVAAGGGAAIAVGQTIDDQVLNNNTSSGPGSSTAPTPSASPTATPTPIPPTPRPTPVCGDCDPDATPPPLTSDDFFRNQRLQAQQTNKQKCGQSEACEHEHPISPHR